ncbi:uncharacterized protein LOC143550808 isoform X4 [Bidens hawaiensis]|uniref:uncharacterized protein LOC143550808 isoform X4 n=1 Tax=Bidens hawaiensis TaxID=980011 RepID=UPI0040495A7B
MDPVAESQSGNLVLFLLWHIVHLIISVVYIIREIFNTIESYLITNGYVNAYTDLNLDRVKYLGIVVDSDEARDISKVVELLEWLSSIGVKRICLYDREGVLKKSKEIFMEKFGSMEITNENLASDPLLDSKRMEIEFVSLSDGKEAVAKAANLLFKKYYADSDSEKPFFTETHLTEALKTLGEVPPWISGLANSLHGDGVRKILVART